MQSIRNHQTHFTRLGGINDLAAIFFVGRERLLAEEVNAGPGGPLCVGTMQVIWQGNVYGIDIAALQAFVELLVSVRLGQTVLLPKFLALLFVSRDDRTPASPAIN